MTKKVIARRLTNVMYDAKVIRLKTNDNSPPLPVEVDRTRIPALAALALAVASAAILLLSLVVPLFTPDQPAAYPSATMRALSAVLSLVFVLAISRWSSVAACAALAANAPFRLADAVGVVSYVTDTNPVSRPELLRPTFVDPQAASGIWLILCGQLFAVVAAVVALWGLRRRDRTGDEHGSSPRWLVGGASGAGALAGLVYLGVAPYGSSNAAMPAQSLLELSGCALLGALLALLSMVLVPVLCASADDHRAVGGGLLGCAISLLVMSLPWWWIAFAAPEANLTVTPVALLVAVVVFTGLGLKMLLRHRNAPLVDHAVAPGIDADGLLTESARSTAEQSEVSLPELRRLHVSFAVLLGSAAVFAGAAGLLPLIRLADGLPPIGGLGAARLVAASALLLVGAAALSSRRLAVRIRPAVLAALVVLPMVTADVVDGVLTATRLAGVSATVAVWLLGLAMLTVLAAACIGALAGGVERDEIGLHEQSLDPVVLTVSALAVIATVSALGLAVVATSELPQPGLWAHFQISSWGLLGGALSSLIAVFIAVRSRRNQAVALLAGTAAVPVLRASELVWGRSGSTAVGAGFYCALAAAALLLIAAGVAYCRQRERPVERGEAAH